MKKSPLLYLKSTFVLLPLSLGFLSYAAQAAQPKADIEEIAVIGTRSETSLQDLPGSIYLLDEAELKHISAVHIQQALSRVPGVSLQRGNGQESLPAVRSPVLTGAGACGSFLMMEEAIPVRGFGFCNVNELFDTHYDQAGRIEVVRGANSAFYGSNGLTGSINIVLPDQGVDSVSIEAGSHDYWRGKGAFSYEQSDDSYGRVYITLSDEGGYRDDAGYDQQKISWRHHSTVGDWTLKPGFTFTKLDQQTAGFIEGLNSYQDSELSKQNLDPEAFRKTEAARAWVRMSKTLSAQRELQITPYGRHTKMDFLQHFLPGDPLEKNKQNGIGWQSSLVTRVSQELTWAVGLDGDISKGELSQQQDGVTKGSAFLVATVPAGKHYDYQVDAWQIGLFAHLDWQFAPNMRLFAGGRFEASEYDYDNKMLAGRTRDDGTECGFGGCRYSRPDDRKDDFSHFSPKLEFQHKLSENFQYHISINDSFRMPQATELYRLQRKQQVADLDIVEARSYEIGTKWSSDRSRIELALYQTDLDNVIIRDSDFFNVDGTKTESRGLELLAEFKFTEQLSTSLTGNWAEHKYNSDQISGDTNINGNDVDTAPDFYGNASLNWQLNDSFSSELQVQHIGDYYLDPENAHRYGGHTLLNWRNQIKINESLQLSLRVINVTDKEYAERADFTSFTDERYFPGEPRSYFAELNYTF